MTDPSGHDWRLLGSGMATAFGAPKEGRLYEITGAQEALALLHRLTAEGGGDEAIILVHEAGGTTVGPLFEEIGAVLSTAGTLGAHIALLAKEYGCPCIVGLKFDHQPAEASWLRITPDGSVWAAEADTP